MNDISFLEEPYANRQFIVVVDDVVAKAKRKTEKETNNKNIDENWDVFYKFLKGFNLIIHPWSWFSMKATEAIIKGLFDLKEKGLNVSTISRSEASKIKFPPGHPRNQVIYVGHPSISNVYYTVAEFHRKTFEHKFSEAVKLLMSLGASNLEVEHVTGWSDDFAIKMNAGIPISNKKVNFGGDINKNKSNKNKILFKANFKNNDSCTLPDNLVWYNHEPNWQQIAEGRLNYGLKDFSLLVHYEDDLGVNVGFKTNAVKAGFDLGGKFEEHRSTVWKIKGVF